MSVIYPLFLSLAQSLSFLALFLLISDPPTPHPPPRHVPLTVCLPASPPPLNGFIPTQGG